MKYLTRMSTVHDSVVVDFGEMEIKMAAQAGADLKLWMNDMLWDEMSAAVAIPPEMLDAIKPRTTNRQRFLENINKLRKNKK